MNQDTLSAIAYFLDGVGSNYTVFLRVYTTPMIVGLSSEQLIRNALGSGAVVEGFQEVTPPEVVSEVTSCMTYVGDRVAGPNPEALKSERFAQLLGQLIDETEQTVRNAVRIEQFWLSEGHPAYPVWWDFAYLLRCPSVAEIFIGSSSD